MITRTFCVFHLYIKINEKYHLSQVTIDRTKKKEQKIKF